MKSDSLEPGTGAGQGENSGASALPPPEDTGRCPATRQKIGYLRRLNRAHPGRRLERQKQRGVQRIRLTGQRLPDDRTIAGFRKDSRRATPGSGS
jgi:hypothetical protein